MYKQKLLHCLSFLYIEINQLGYGLGTSPNQGGGNIRVLLAPYYYGPYKQDSTSTKERLVLG